MVIRADRLPPAAVPPLNTNHMTPRLPDLVAAGEREVGEGPGKALVKDGTVVATAFVAQRRRKLGWFIL